MLELAEQMEKLDQPSEKQKWTYSNPDRMAIKRVTNIYTPFNSLPHIPPRARGFGKRVLPGGQGFDKKMPGRRGTAIIMLKIKLCPF